MAFARFSSRANNSGRTRFYDTLFRDKNFTCHKSIERPRADLADRFSMWHARLFRRPLFVLSLLLFFHFSLSLCFSFCIINFEFKRNRVASANDKTQTCETRAHLSKSFREDSEFTVLVLFRASRKCGARARVQEWNVNIGITVNYAALMKKTRRVVSERSGGNPAKYIYCTLSFSLFLSLLPPFSRWCVYIHFPGRINGN